MWWTSRKACCICLFLTRSLGRLSLTWRSVVFICFDLRIWFPFFSLVLFAFVCCAYAVWTTSSLLKHYHLSPHLVFDFGSSNTPPTTTLCSRVFSNILVGLSLQVTRFTRRRQCGDCGSLHPRRCYAGSSGRREISTEFQHYRVCAVVRAHLSQYNKAGTF